ncbi:membrane protein [Pontibacter korlensis]|uniref:Membrane protein n=1 Tax=Pontibacter korlensis TaxID=400092 RepID=A0A0E3UYR8_9BACT|nr:membrane protein [Pontibacter korlensis]AKD05382.1 membrane protein [Pontibacter korlensis]
MKQKLATQLNAINEYEREPIPQSKLKGLKSFVGMYAGEHIAGTEFVIGPLFVVHGVSAPDLFLGLLVGNLLAVLSWAFLCAPIAVKVRLTLYYQLEKICGRYLVTGYNIVNALMFCFLAGSMIAVAATAAGIPFDIAMPGLTDWYPNSLSWVITVLLVGLVITLIAILGYEQISRFANVCAPWMILIFVAAAFAVMPQLGITSFSSFWEVAQTRIWTGVPMEGFSKFTFWHVTFFAWFANMAMHIGMGDLSILRYAKKWQYGFASTTGMFIGHVMAWISSGILCAAAGGEIPPGPIAYNSVGIAGAICVMIAGWTTANPTIYRAGLAIQSIMPSVKRWKVTLIVGLVTTIAAMFPALVMKLLDFVALYGLVLMPMGAIIFIDFYVIPKLGLTRNYASEAKIKFNIAAGVTWLSTLALCLFLNFYQGIDIFFLGLPGWFIAAALYIVLSKLYQRKAVEEPQLRVSAKSF